MVCKAPTGFLSLLSNRIKRGEVSSQGHRIAKGQSAKWWQLRATMSLARLLRDTGRREEARAMLAQIYNWFTEASTPPT